MSDVTVFLTDDAKAKFTAKNRIENIDLFKKQLSVY